jgi:uncharacterized protein (UPF0332 family)
MKKINWCFNIKKGLKLVEPNKNISNSYLEFAEKTLSRIKFLIEEEDYLWASVRIYYCSYYCVYSFLQRIGVKSENHDCSIELIKFLLKDKFIEDVELFKKGRIESQYYLNVGQKQKLLSNYKKVKEFYLEFKEKLENLSRKDIDLFRNKLEDFK